MASSLTPAGLRHLARLYRADVDGAGEMLSAIIDEQAHDLPDLLGFPLTNLERLRDHDNPVEVLVATIEGAPRVARELRDRIHFESAASQAVRLAQTAVHRPGGHIALDVALLGEVIGRYPGRIVTFGERGSLGAGRLRAVLRLTRDLRATSVVVTAEHLVVMYEGDNNRGLIKLVLHEPIIDHDTLVVPLGQMHSYGDVSVAIQAESHNRGPHEVPSCPDVAPGDTEERYAVPQSPEKLLGANTSSTPRPRTSVRGVAFRLIEAVAAVMLGGSP